MRPDRFISFFVAVLVAALFAAVWFVTPARPAEPVRRPALAYSELVGRAPRADVGLRRRPCDARCRRALVLPLAPPAPVPAQQVSSTPHP